jgi:hypothetical protein
MVSPQAEEAMTTPRRAFLKGLAAAPLVPAGAASEAAPAAAAAPPAGREAVAEALAEALKREFGAHLDASDLAAVKKELVRGLESAERLRQEAGLRNADGPVNLFEARPPARAAQGGRR